MSDNKERKEEKEEGIKEVAHNMPEEDNVIQECEQLIVEEQDEFLKIQLRKKEQKMKEMEHDISEKDNRIQKYEQQVVEQRNKILEMEKTIAELEKELHAIEDTDDNKKVQELEMKIHFLKDSHAERVITIEKLIVILNEKQKIEFELRDYIKYAEKKLRRLESELLKKERFIAGANGKHETKLKRECDQQVSCKSLQYTKVYSQIFSSLDILQIPFIEADRIGKQE